MTKEKPSLREVQPETPRPSWGIGFARLPHLAAPDTVRLWYARTSLLLLRTRDVLPRLDRKAASSARPWWPVSRRTAG